MRLAHRSGFGLIVGGGLALAGGVAGVGCGSGFDGCRAARTCSSEAGSSGAPSAGRGGAGIGGKAGGGGVSAAAGKAGSGGAGVGDAGGAAGSEQESEAGGTSRGSGGVSGGAGGRGMTGDAGRDEGNSEAGAAGQAGASSDTTAPSIVKVTTFGSDTAWPDDGGKGLTSDASVLVVFDEAMDREKTEAAYVSLDLPSSAVRFLWSEGDSWLVIQPLEPLPYRDVRDLATDPTRYSFEIAASAADVAGNELGTSRTFMFTTLRHVQQVIEPLLAMNETRSSDDDSLTDSTACSDGSSALVAGDDDDDDGMMAFVTFGLNAVAPDLFAWNDATLSANLEVVTAANPYAHLGHMDAYATTDLPSELRWDSPLTDLGTFAHYEAQTNTTVDVLPTMESDYSTGPFASFAFRFLTPTDGDHNEARAAIPCSGLRLTLDYLAP